MPHILRVFLTCLALAFVASASGMRAPAVERGAALHAELVSPSLETCSVLETSIQLGDQVLAFNEWKPKSALASDTRLSYEKVVDIYTSYKQQTLVHLTLDNGQQLTATAGHPFKTTEGWRDAVLLKKGGKLLLKGGDGDADAVAADLQLNLQLNTPVAQQNNAQAATELVANDNQATSAAQPGERAITIADIRLEVTTVPVYNLEVANAHTFFVGVDGVLVHNASANKGIAKPHGGPAHDARIETYLRRLGKWTSVDPNTIRKNQWQVPYGCNKAVGRNRPDVQFDYKGKHYNREFDTIPANSTAHGTTILGNDPLSIFTGSLVK